MTDTTAHEGYERIGWADVREGDVLLHPNGDRLTVSAVDYDGYQTCKSTAGSWHSVSTLRGSGFFPYRKVEPLPTTPGHYLDAGGYHWKLTSNATQPWYLSVGDHHFTTEEAQEDAPFTRLVPMPTREQIDSIVESNVGEHDSLIADKVAVTAAVMALLTGEGGGDDE